MTKTNHKKTLFFLILIIAICSGLCSCSISKENQEKINQIIEMIDALPTSSQLTVEDEYAITKARVSYNNLDMKLRNKVTNLNKLEQLEKEMVDIRKQAVYQEQAKRVIARINQLPSEEALVLSDDEQLISVRNSYDNIEPLARILVTNYPKLESLEIKMSKMKKEASYFAQAQAVADLIDNLPSVNELTIDDETRVVEARDAYIKLPQELKPFVNNTEKLDELERRIRQLKYEDTYVEEAKRVTKLIDALPEVNAITLKDESKVIAARRAYDSLLDEFKYLVTNIDKLVALENQILFLQNEKENRAAIEKVVNAIDQLQDVDEITYDSVYEVETARSYYEELATYLREYVTNYDKLVAVEAKMIELIPYTVHLFNVLEGEVEEGTMVEIPEHYLSEIITYYTMSFFQKYQSEVFIYQTSLLGDNDVYQYALKIGFNYDALTGNYQVTQIIESSVKLTPELRLSDYYVLIHPANEEDYANAMMIEIGDRITIDKELPTSATSEWYAKLLVSSTRLDRWTNYCSMTYSGETILPTLNRNGYHFDGWYLNPECTGEKITKVSEKKILYASWKKVDEEQMSKSSLNITLDETTLKDEKSKRNSLVGICTNKLTRYLYVNKQDLILK